MSDDRRTARQGLADLAAEVDRLAAENGITFEQQFDNLVTADGVKAILDRLATQPPTGDPS